MSEGRVFIVDDRPDEIRVLGEMLRAHGYEVELATTGQGALEAIPESLPELVIVDLGLPDVDGLTVCRLLRGAAVTSDIPIICMSEADRVETRVESFEHGAVDYVQKPFETAEVLARVKRHVTVSRVREALKESEAKFRSVTESAIDAIISADREGTIRSWNRAAEAKLRSVTESALDAIVTADAEDATTLQRPGPRADPEAPTAPRPIPGGGVGPERGGRRRKAGNKGP